MPDRAPAKGTLMQGKRGLIMGVANDRSLAWGIAAACAAQGAELAFTYQGEALEKRVRPLAESRRVATWCVPCDVDRRGQHRCRLRRAASSIGAGSISWSTPSAIADKQYLRGRYLDTPRAAFLQALDISCYSFAAVGAAGGADDDAGRQSADPDLSRRRAGGCRTTTSWAWPRRRWRPRCAISRPISAAQASGSTRSAPGRSRRWPPAASAISATSCAGTSSTRRCSATSRSRRSAAPALYLLSDLASGVTGEVHHVDCGYHIVGMKNPDAPDIAIVEAA